MTKVFLREQGYDIWKEFVTGYDSSKREKTTAKKGLKQNKKIAMDFIFEGLYDSIKDKVGKCSPAKELWDKLHNIYSSPITKSENAKEYESTEQEERCSSCQTDSEEEEEYEINKSMCFCFKCEKGGHLEFECPYLKIESDETTNLNEVVYIQRERELEGEIVTLKIQLEEARRTKEVMKIQMKKKEEDCENLEEVVVLLRVKVVKIGINIEEASTPSVNIFEEKCHRSSEGKSEEKPKSYVEAIKGSIKKEECKPLKKNIPKGHKTPEEYYRRDGHQRIPSTFRKPRSFTHNEGVNLRKDHDQPKHYFIRTRA
jgi:hypothetical protein